MQHLADRFSASKGASVVERVMAVIGLIVTAPITAIAAVAIRFASRGPALYRARRVGVGGEEFTMLKLRTMHVDQAVRGSITGGDDPRVFGVGRLLRTLKIDELPQLVNIARGEMAFVGPRPEAPDIVAANYKPWMRETLEIPPGIVGPGSLGYYLEEDALPDDPAGAAEMYANVLLPRKLARDLVFVRRRTLGYRLELVARTILGILRLRNITRRWQEREDRAAAEILREVRDSS